MEQIFEKTVYDSYNNKTKEEKQELSDAIEAISLINIGKTMDKIKVLYGHSLCAVSPIENYDSEGMNKLAIELTELSKQIQQDVLDLAEKIRIAGTLIER